MMLNDFVLLAALAIPSLPVTACVSPGPCGPNVTAVNFEHLKRVECVCDAVRLIVHVNPVTGYLAGAHLTQLQQCEALCWAVTDGVGAPDYSEPTP